MDAAAGRVHLTGKHAIAGTGGQTETTVHARVRRSSKNSVYFLGNHRKLIYRLMIAIDNNISEISEMIILKVLLVIEGVRNC